MQKMENMVKIVKFIFFMIIILSPFVVATNLDVILPCVEDDDCPYDAQLCPPPGQIMCIKSICSCRNSIN
ncbi:unnamed protein product [Trifolium pratense]|uniref:Uncharacterized protein n=2 Tax=Trifolium pratense TaxID=57577 RepID=A0ACB0LJQ6_TRIPR|nr:unnamed protein product [Trifolium pratense]CAJ2669739.1 unnamed protein product [Trifolium pratense]